MAHDCGDGALLSLDTALALYGANLHALPAVERPLAEALGHVLAAPVSSAVDLPLFTQSAVDGYALHAADIAAASAATPVRLPVIGEVRAGVAPDAPLPRGAAMRIFTGGRLPTGADVIARQEIVTREGAAMLLHEPLPAGCDVRERGEELRVGAPLAAAGQRLHSGLVAALAMAGVSSLRVIAQPHVSVLVTGDEVSASPQNEAGVYDANGPLVRSWFVERGHAVPRVRNVVDDREQLTAALREALDSSDLVLTTGGVSVGDHDLVRPVASSLGVREVFWQVAQKPGKPLYFGLRETAGRQQVLIGLPGNPGAVLIGLHVHVAAVLAHLQHLPAPVWLNGRLSSAVREDSREQLLRMTQRVDEEGQVHLDRLDRQASHMLSNLSQADALVRIPAGKALGAGARVRWIALSR